MLGKHFTYLKTIFNNCKQIKLNYNELTKIKNTNYLSKLLKKQKNKKTYSFDSS